MPVEDPDDPNTPLFHEVMSAWRKRFEDNPWKPGELPVPPIGVQVQELQRKVALSTPTQYMEVISNGVGDGECQ